MSFRVYYNKELDKVVLLCGNNSSYVCDRLFDDGKLKEAMEEEEETTVDSPVVSSPSSTEKNTRRCGKCRKPGHTVRTCPDTRLKNGDGRVMRDGNPLLTKEEFEAIKERQEEGMTSMDAAYEGNLTLAEVNKAFQSSNYEYYRDEG